MSEGVLAPNMTKKFQKEESQIANEKLPCSMLWGGLSVNSKCKLRPPNKKCIGKNMINCLANSPMVENSKCKIGQVENLGLLTDWF